MKILFIFGTRPEAIKLAPVIRTLHQRFPSFDVNVVVTAQHRQMLDQVLEFYQIEPDFDLNLMQPNQNLFDITARTLQELRGVIEQCKPDNIFIQGDTTTSFCGALAGYYFQTKVSHVEAGLRSGNKYAPYPEEKNRILTGHLADYHFAPTDRARKNLAEEGITNNVWVVGNTVIDALLLGLETIKEKSTEEFHHYFDFIDFSHRLVLITGHRRESFGKPFENIADALRDVAFSFPKIQFVYPVHLNPHVKEPVNRILSGLANVHLIDPLDYQHFIWLMSKSYLVVTDSGGIQEEAPTLGIPVLVMRDITERPEGIEAGTAKLVGTQRERIVQEVSNLLTDDQVYTEMARARNPYGDGTSSQQIADILLTI